MNNIYGHDDNNSWHKISLIEEISNLSPIDSFTFFEDFTEYDVLSMLSSDMDLLIMQSQGITEHQQRSTTPEDTKNSNDQYSESSEETNNKHYTQITTLYTNYHIDIIF